VDWMGCRWENLWEQGGDKKKFMEIGWGWRQFIFFTVSLSRVVDIIV